MLNVVVLIGRLAKDPELRYTSQGTAVTNFRLAVNRDYKSKTEDQTADFFNVICWKRLAEVTAQHLVKGRLIAVNGRLQSRSVDKNGQRRTYVEVVADNVKYLDSKQQPEQQSNNTSVYQQSYSKYTQSSFNSDTSDSDDLPFDC